MSSRVFKARTGHTESNPQICGLSGREIAQDDPILYLVCRGNDARPEYQVKVTREESKQVEYRGRKRKVTERDYGTDDGTEFRNVFGGWQTNPKTGQREKVFEWQQKIGDSWHPVETWSHIVLAQVAADLGYDVRTKKNGKWAMTRAHEGDRAVGNEHSVASESINAMEELARAACTPEELGLVPPKPKAEAKVQVTMVETLVAEEREAVAVAVAAEQEADVDAEDAANAKALGMSLAAYRRIQAGL